MNTRKHKSINALSVLVLLLALTPSLTTLAQGYGPYGNGGYYPNNAGSYGPAYGYPPRPQVVVVTPPPPPVVVAPPTVIIQRPPVFIAGPRPWGSYYGHRPRFFGRARW